MKVLKTHKTFEGLTQFWSHESNETKTEMKFATFIPQGKIEGCIIWLSGLTCTDENFITKAGAQKYLAENNLMVIAPDTSPRGLNLPGEHDSYDFGSGAGFYVDATTADYKTNYRMYSYITNELYSVIQNHFKVARISIMGHSMGGHGALVIGLRESDKFRSISAFSPIVNPTQAPWGQKAFQGYLGADQTTWKAYDACELMNTGAKHAHKILVHQGTKDEFLLNGQLLTQNWVETCQKHGQDQEVVFAEDYDHSYYFIATFIEAHIKHHAKFLKQ